MIRDLFAALGPHHARPLRRLLALMGAAAVLQGVAFALLVPILEALLGTHPADVTPWLMALGAVWIAYGISHFSAALAGFQTGAKVCQSLHHRIEDKVASLPLAWFTADRVGQLGRLTSQRVIDVMSVPAHLLRELVDALLTPATVVVVLFAFDWRLAGALAISGVVVAQICRRTGDWVQAADRGADAIHADACGRIVEFARMQPVLRAFGRNVDGNQFVSAALAAQRSASWSLVRAAVPGVVALSVATPRSAVLRRVRIRQLHAERDDQPR
jgi:ATP-binding cassette subfamily B protein